MQTLLVDDDVEMRLLLGEVLRARGHEVLACADAETAWAAYQEEAYPLALLDLSLPGMDGLQLCRQQQALAQVVHVSHGAPLAAIAQDRETPLADHVEELGLARRLVRAVEPRRPHDHRLEVAPRLGLGHDALHLGLGTAVAQVRIVG